MRSSLDIPSERARLDAVLSLFTDRIRGYVTAEMKGKYGDAWYEHRRVRQLLGFSALKGPHDPPHIDCLACIKLIDAYWKPVFQHSYRGDRGLFRVVRQLRNEFAHQELITSETVIFAESACHKCLKAAGLSVQGLSAQLSGRSLDREIDRSYLADLVLWLSLAFISGAMLYISSLESTNQQWISNWRLICFLVTSIAAISCTLLKVQFLPRARLGIRERWLSASAGTSLGVVMAAGYGLLLPFVWSNRINLSGFDLRFAAAVLLGGMGASAGQQLGFRRGLMLTMIVVLSMALSSTLSFLLIRQTASLELGLWTGNLCAYVGVGLTNAVIVSLNAKKVIRALGICSAALTSLPFLLALAS